MAALTLDMFGANRKQHGKRTLYLISTVKYGHGNVRVWGGFTASGCGQIAVLESIMNSAISKCA